jgi:hypothetical protein
MKLPNNEIGISDILDYRECPQRFALKMRRHSPLPERFQLYPNEKAEQHRTFATVYGTAVHDAIEIIEREQVSDDEAISRVWAEHGNYLEPDDIERMKADLAVYRTRTETGYKLVGTEIEFRVPLFVHEGEQVYFRCRIDVMYQRIDNPGVFLMRDYKSGRMPKSEPDIHKDLQQWSYNWAAHEFMPEIETLVQIYDQLRFGAVPTRKSTQQREQIRNWIVKQVKAILEDELLKPKSNEWCHTCPIMPDCRITHLAPEFWVNRLGALAPERKVGRKLVVELTDEHAGFEVYVDVYKRAKLAVKVIERYIEAVEAVLKAMPQERRDEFGFELAKERAVDTFDAEALRRVQDIVGPDAVHLFRMSKKAVQDFFGEDSDEAKQILALAVKKHTAAPLKAQR